MDGYTYFLSLMNIYKGNNQFLFGNYSFNAWIKKKDNTFNFQFNGNRPKKSVPQKWLIDGKNAMNKGYNIDRSWFLNNFGVNDCRVSVAIWLLHNH